MTWRRVPSMAWGLALALAGTCLVGCGSDEATVRKDKPEVADRPGPEPPVAEEPPQTEAAGTFYEVKAGDTLWEIARRHRIAVEELVEVNGLERPDQLAVGQLIFIPDDDGLALVEAAPAPAPRPAARTTPSTGELAWPLDEGVLLREFEPEGAVPYEGLLLAAPRGTEVKASAAGEVVFVGDEGTTLGRMVILKHEGGLLTIYAHLDGASVTRGEKVARGQVVGSVGTTGRVDSPQLHFQVRRSRSAVDPLGLLQEP